MVDLFIDDNDESGDGLLFSTETLKACDKECGGIINIIAVNEKTREQVDMYYNGYHLTLEDAKGLHKLLGEVIAEQEAK